jgi:hypothetical protein
MTRNLSCMLVFAAAVLPAAESLGTPVAGYVAAPPRAELRAILGVPGSYLLSDPLTLPDGVTRIRLAPGQDYALVERGSHAPAAVVLKAGAVDHVTEIPGALAAADWVAFSSGARAVVLYSSAAKRMQVVTGLPDTPAVARELDASMLAVEPSSAATGDDGAMLVAASSESVYLLAPDGAGRLLFSGSEIRDVAVLANGTDAVAADAGSGSVYLLSSSGAPRVLAGGLEGITRIFPGADGRTLFGLRPGSRTVSWIDVPTGAVNHADVGEETSPASDFLPLRNRDTFLIAARPRQPAWIFYRDGNLGRVVFVPAATTTGRVK